MNNKNILAFCDCGEFGKIRMIYNGEDCLFCGRDIACAMKFGNPGKAVYTNCKNIYHEMHITNSGKQCLNFIDMDDVLRLYKHGKYDMPDFLRLLAEIREKAAYEFATEEEPEQKPGVEAALEEFVNQMHRLLTEYGIVVKIADIYSANSKS